MTDETPEEKSKLKPASENPWYVLMTIAGEQDGEDIDWDLHAKNRRYFNSLMAGALKSNVKDELAGRTGVLDKDLAEITDDEISQISSAVASRLSIEFDPKMIFEEVTIMDTEFMDKFVVSGFIFIESFSIINCKIQNVFESSDAVYLSGFSIEKCAFLGDISISGSEIYENFLICDMRACSNFYCISVKFFAIYKLLRCIFDCDAVFMRSNFGGYSVFEGVEFFGCVDFSSSKFEYPTRFNAPIESPENGSGVRFAKMPPFFFGATIHDDTDFSGVDWPDIPSESLGARSHRRAYERLKLLMDSQNKFHDEHMFLRKELQCREVEWPGTWATVASRVYGFLSNYGWSVRRPCWGLGITILLGWALIFIGEWWDFNLGDWPLDEEGNSTAEYLGFWQSGSLSLSNVFGFLGLSRTFLADEIKTLTAFSEVVSAIQTVLGLILVFLMGLALRNRFRIK